MEMYFLSTVHTVESSTVPKRSEEDYYNNTVSGKSFLERLNKESA